MKKPSNNLPIKKSAGVAPLAWIVLALVLAGGGWLVFSKNGARAPAPDSSAAPSAPAIAATVDGKQVFEVLVKEGYQPKEIAAKAGVPVVLKMKTQGTFDCSTTFSIPKLGIHLRLESTGESAVEIPAQLAGETLYGVCGMGMYHLAIKFS